MNARMGMINGWTRVVVEIVVVFTAIVVSFVVVREDVKHLTAEIQRVERQSEIARSNIENRVDARLIRIEDKLDRLLEAR